MGIILSYGLVSGQNSSVAMRNEINIACVLHDKAMYSNNCSLNVHTTYYL